MPRRVDSPLFSRISSVADLEREDRVVFDWAKLSGRVPALVRFDHCSRDTYIGSSSHDTFRPSVKCRLIPPSGGLVDTGCGAGSP